MEYEAYVDAQYYKDNSKGMIPDDVLEQRLIMASHEIDSLTYNRINKLGFENLTTFQKEIVKKSVCAHADFLYEYGDFLNLPLSGYSAGMTSVSFSSTAVVEQNGITTTNGVQSILKQTGLIVRLIR